MNRTIRHALRGAVVLAALAGAAGCTDSNSTIVFDAAASEGKGDGAGPSEGGKPDASTASDGSAGPDGDAAAPDAETGAPPSDGSAASDAVPADAEPGQ